MRSWQWHWLLFVVVFLLILPHEYQDYRAHQLTPWESPLPPPGLSVTVMVQNVDGPGHRTDGPYALNAGVAVPPSDTVGMPERPPIPCAFKLTVKQGNRLWAEYDVAELTHGSEGPYAGYHSEDFSMPAGESSVDVANVGCAQDYRFTGGIMSVSPIYRDALGSVLLAQAGYYIGLLLAAFETLFCIFLSARAFLAGPQPKPAKPA